MHELNMKELWLENPLDFNNDQTLNIAEICPITHTLGPGQRFAIWVQGCCFHCHDCISPDWIPLEEANLIEVKSLAKLILKTKDIDGLTISGGEPMLQAKALLQLSKYLKEKRDLSIICFTGFTLRQLMAKNNAIINNFLNIIDVLIDGQFISELNDNKGWRGSSNQVVHFLSERHLSDKDFFLNRSRHIEFHLRDNELLMVGVPPRNFKPKLDQVTHLDS